MANRWTDKAQEPVARLSSLRALLDELAPQCDAAQMEEMRRLKRVIHVAESRLADRKPELLSQSALGAIAGNVQATWDAAQAAKAAAQAAGPLNLTPVNDAADGILEALRTAPSPPIAPRAVEEASAGLLEDSQLVQSRLETKADELTVAMAQAAESASNQVQAAKGALDSASQEFAQAVATNKQQIADLQTRVDTLIDNQQTNFSTALENQRTAFGTLLEDMRKELDEWKVNQQQLASEQMQSAAEQAKTILGQMDVALRDAQRVAGIVAVTGLSGGYKDHADRERKATFWWRLATVALGGAAVAFLIWAAVHAGTTNQSWVRAAVNAGVAVAFGSLAYYTGRIAGRHHARAAHYRSRELALRSLGPYVDRLDEARQQDLLKELAPGFFTELQENPAEVDWSSPAASGFIDQIVARVVAQLAAKS